jgi:hypothetical protein
MLQQSYALSSKIKVACEYGKPCFVEKHLGFYTNYSSFILKALRKTSFQEFLYQMLLSENIEEKTVNAVNIEVFPAATKNGLNIVGRCDTFRGKIRIYPKSFYFCNAVRKKLGKEVLYAFVGNRARAALMHELLHLKYANDETKVRELTDVYFRVYMKKRFNENPAFLHSLIFSTRKRSK